MTSYKFQIGDRVSLRQSFGSSVLWLGAIVKIKNPEREHPYQVKWDINRKARWATKAMIKPFYTAIDKLDDVL